MRVYYFSMYNYFNYYNPINTLIVRINGTLNTNLKPLMLINIVLIMKAFSY
jgi:hypothetical protein